MCGRYWIDDGEDGLNQIISQMQRTDIDAKLSGEVFPGDRVPVVCRSRSGKPLVYPMEWGFRREGGGRVINARSETAQELPLFRESMRLRRCLIPMSAYYEWERRGKEKTRYRIFPENGDIHCLAGIYRYEDEAPRFAVLTREAAPEIRFIHARMPVILPYALRDEWLEGEYFHLGQAVPLRFRPGM